MHEIERNHRRSIRLKEYDYSLPGYYFVTICMQNRECLLGDIAGDKMQLNRSGEIAYESWIWMEKQYPYIEHDIFVLMPNHIHGIIIIDEAGRGGSRTAPSSQISGIGFKKQKTLGRLIGVFKTVSTKSINILRNSPGALVWQRNYYEHIIRNEKELYSIRQYITFNPLNWAIDEEAPPKME